MKKKYHPPLDPLPSREGKKSIEEEIKRYRRVSTARKLKWLDDMRHLLFAAMTPKLAKRRDALRKMGY